MLECASLICAAVGCGSARMVHSLLPLSTPAPSSASAAPVVPFNRFRTEWHSGKDFSEFIVVEEMREVAEMLEGVNGGNGNALLLLLFDGDASSAAELPSSSTAASFEVEDQNDRVTLLWLAGLDENEVLPAVSFK